MRASITMAAPLLALLLLPAVISAQGAQASYPPYARPASTYAPPRTPDGQPDISGLYVAIPLPRGIETPLVPMVNRAPTAQTASSPTASTNVPSCRRARSSGQPESIRRTERFR